MTRSLTARHCGVLSGSPRSRQAVPDATAQLQFRHVLKENEPATKQLFEAIRTQLPAKGLMMREGTIADAARRVRGHFPHWRLRCNHARNDRSC